MIMGILHYSSENPLLASMQAKWVTSPVLPTDSFCSQSPHQCGFGSWFLSITLESSPWWRIQRCSIPISAETVCAITCLVFLDKVTLLVENTEWVVLEGNMCVLSGKRRCVGGINTPPVYVYSKVHCRKQWATELQATVQPSHYSVADCIQQVSPLAPIEH